MKAENHPKALFALGYLDEQQGRYGTAIELYKQAKAEGSLAAAYNLGRCQEIGRGTVKNIKGAEKEYLYAAKLVTQCHNSQSDYWSTIRATKKKTTSKPSNGGGWPEKRIEPGTEALSKIKQSRLLTKEEIAMGESDASRLEETIRSNLKPHKSQYSPIIRNKLLCPIRTRNTSSAVFSSQTMADSYFRRL